MTEVERPSLASIRRRVDETSISRARNYLSDDRWGNLRVRGPVISGLCQGTANSPYRVVDYWSMTRDPDVSDFRVSSARLPLHSGSR